MKRVAWAHLPWSGGSLCGDTTTIEACPECVRRLVSLLLVHVQSLRRPRKSFCGRVIVRRTDDLQPAVISDVVTEAQADTGPILFWVTPDQAREMIRLRRQSSPSLPQAPNVWEGWPIVPPVCQACEANLVRFDEARPNGSPVPRVGPAPVVNDRPSRSSASSRGRNGVGRRSSEDEP